MRRSLLLVASLIFALNRPAFAQDKGTWQAASTTALGITGDIAISSQTLAINFTTYPLAPIRALQQAEISAVFSSVEKVTGSGNLYRLNVPGTKRFLHRNTLCGSDDTQWMVTYVDGKTLLVAFFSGSDTPALTPEAMAKTTDLCGTFTYTR
jgi:hypothetical protein